MAEVCQMIENISEFQHGHKKRKDSLETQAEWVVLRAYVEN